MRSKAIITALVSYVLFDKYSGFSIQEMIYFIFAASIFFSFTWQMLENWWRAH